MIKADVQKKRILAKLALFGVIVGVIILAGVFFWPGLVLANQAKGGGTVFGGGTFGEYIQNVYTFSIGALALAAVIMIIIAGYRYATAAGNEQRLSDSKDMITSAITGLLVILLAWLILNTLNPALVSFPGIPEMPKQSNIMNNPR